MADSAPKNLDPKHAIQSPDAAGKRQTRSNRIKRLVSKDGYFIIHGSIRITKLRFEIRIEDESEEDAGKDEQAQAEPDIVEVMEKPQPEGYENSAVTPFRQRTG